MAVIGAITARVIVNRHPAQEYRCLSSDSNAIEGPNVNTVYIEVKPEGIFHFRIDIAEAFAWDGTDTVSVEVQLNGKLIRAGCCRKAHRNEDGSWSLEISGVYKKRGDEIKKIKWKFEKLNNRAVRDGDTLSEMAHKYGDLGIMTLNIRRSKFMFLHPNGSPRKGGPPSFGEVPGAALKDKNLSITTGIYVEQADKTPDIFRVKRHDRLPIAQFNFLYRTRKDLKAHGVIENTPDPTPLAKRDLDDMNMEELREYARRVRAEETRRDERRKIKRKRDTGGTTAAQPSTPESDDRSDSDDLEIIEKPRAKKAKTSMTPRSHKKK